MQPSTWSLVTYRHSFSSGLGIFSPRMMCQESSGSSVLAQQSIISQSVSRKRERKQGRGGEETETETERKKGGRREEGSEVTVQSSLFVPSSLIVNPWNPNPHRHSYSNS